MNRSSAVVMVCLLGSVACDGGEENVDAFSPVLMLDQDTVALGNVALGERAEGRLGVHNAGTGPLEVEATLRSGPWGMTLAHDRLTVAPGTSEPLWVNLLGTEPGPVTATLTLRHNGRPDANGDQRVDVSVTATVLAPPSCDDDNPCTLDLHDPADPTRCEHHPVTGSCDDHNSCTSLDRCEAGVCTGTVLPCDDGVSCTADRCDPTVGGCVHEPVDARCSDDNACSLDTCRPGGAADVRGCVHAVAPNGTQCGALGCGTVDLCVSGACTALPTPAGYPCEDGNPCTVGDSCSEGACVPGSSAQLHVGAPTLVTEAQSPGNILPEAVQPGSLFGLEAVDVAGSVVVFPLNAADPVVTGPDVLVAWQGASAGWGSQCTFTPSYCSTGRSSCDATTDDRVSAPLMSLQVSRLHPQAGTMEPPVTLDTAAVQSAVAAALQASTEDFGSPSQGSVVTTRALPRGDHLLVGAIIHFASACGGCFANGGPGNPPTPPNARPSCLESGHAMALLRADATGFSVLDVSFFASTGPATGKALATGPLGMPLLAMALDGNDVVLSSLQLSDDQGAYCDGPGCGAGQASAVVRRVTLQPNGSGLAGPAVHQVVPFYTPWPGVAGNAQGLSAALDSDGTVALMWRQQSGSPPPPSACAPTNLTGGSPLTDLVTLDLLPETATTQVVAPLASYGAFVGGRSSSTVVWHQQSYLQDDACVMEDVVLAHTPDGTQELMRMTSDQAVRSVEALSFLGQPLAAATLWGGQLALALPTPGTTPWVMQTAFGAAEDTAFGAERHLALATDGVRAFAVTFAAVGTNRDSLPSGGLATFTLGCAAPSDVVPVDLP